MRKREACRFPHLKKWRLKSWNLSWILSSENWVQLSLVLQWLTLLCRKTRLQGDLIILGQTLPLNEEGLLPKNLPPMVFPEKTLLARYAFSQALSRSTALSALEVQLESYLASMALLPHALAQTGKPRMGRTQLIKKLGELMKFRQLLNLNRENFSEVPDFYWAEPELEGKFRFVFANFLCWIFVGYFKSLSGALEVKARTASFNDKITYAAEAQSMLRQLLTEVRRI